jgi:type IV pilus assembly protein PilM
MALYNAFRFNYSELTGSSLVIYIGARTTNLLFIEPGKVFSRSIPIGGSSITAAIAKEFNEPFGAAELRKKHDGFINLGGPEMEISDPDIARVAKLVRSTTARLHAEVTRSISFYRTQQQGSRPEHVFLCGGTASMPYMRVFPRLQWPVEFFNPLRNVAVGESVAIAEVARLRPFVWRIGRARASQHHGVSNGVEPATGQCRAPAATAQRRPSC